MIQVFKQHFFDSALFGATAAADADAGGFEFCFSPFGGGDGGFAGEDVEDAGAEVGKALEGHRAFGAVEGEGV